MRVALAYMRYSSKQQGSGSTLTRQRQLINKWVDDQKREHGEVYEIKWYIDKGLSGWTGKNKEGALGDLLKDAKNYPAGTPILVESVDRLTRGGIQETQAILNELTFTGVVVHAIMDRQVIHNEDLNTIQGVVTIIAYADSARKASDIKSERVSASKERNWKLAKEGKKLVTSHLPGWLYKDADGKLQVDPKKQALVKEIFELRLAGSTFQGIADVMNDRQEPVLNSRKGASNWLPNSIRSLLHNRATIGYLPASKVNKKYEEIEGYFPPVISSELFYAVNDVSVPAVRGKERKEKAQYPETVYLLKKLVRCKYCGGNVFPNGAKPGYWGRVRCMGHHTKVCEAPPISRYDLEHILVTKLFPLLKYMEVGKEQSPVASLQARIDHLSNIIGGYYDDLEDIPREDKAMRRDINSRISKRSVEREELERQLALTKRKMDVRTENTLSGLDFNNYSDRLKMQLVINRNIERIVLDTLFDRVHVKLVNGNALMNFPLYGDVDASHTLVAAMDNKTGISADVEQMLGLTDTLPTVYNLAHQELDTDDREFPDVESDYPNDDGI
ncbi:TPA: recombinase family protein [Escherichia coli]|nr:recombinase family protein [Escherichia coli]HDS7611732.1 recombinase family protein [Escherichia coli]